MGASAAAKQLEQQGISLIIGDMEVADSPLKDAICAVKPTHAFLMSNEKMAALSKGHYCKQELAAANRMMDLLEATGTVQYVVMSSVAGCHEGNSNGVPNFKVKADIEEALKGRRIKWTILRHRAGEQPDHDDVVRELPRLGGGGGQVFREVVGSRVRVQRRDHQPGEPEAERARDLFGVRERARGRREEHQVQACDGPVPDEPGHHAGLRGDASVLAGLGVPDRGER